MNNTDVTCEHIGQIFQQPQGRDHFETLFAPFADIELAVGDTCRYRGGQLDQIAAYQSRTQINSYSRRIDVDVFRVGGLRDHAAVGQGFCCGYYRQLDISGHKFGGLAVGLGHTLLYLVIGDLPGQFAAKSDGIESGNPVYSDPAGAEPFPRLAHG